MPSMSAAADRPEIVQRDLRFPMDQVELRSWHPLGPHVSHFFNTLSVFFPEGETFFIDAVRHYAGRVRAPRLREEVRAFCGQEAMHSREHRRYNRALAEAGCPVRKLEKAIVWRLDLVRKIAPRAHHLAVTIALEHFTAILADLVLTEKELLEGADPRMAAVWRWHAIEETEHKAVAFDVYQEVIGSGPGGYLLRCGVMLMVTAIFWTLVSFYHFRMIRADGTLTDLAGWRKLGRMLLISPGTLPKLLRPWLAWFRPGFHPWQHDNRELVRSWQETFEATGEAPA